MLFPILKKITVVTGAGGVARAVDWTGRAGEVGEGPEGVAPARPSLNEMHLM